MILSGEKNLVIYRNRRQMFFSIETIDLEVFRRNLLFFGAKGSGFFLSKEKLRKLEIEFWSHRFFQARAAILSACRRTPVVFIPDSRRCRFVALKRKSTAPTSAQLVFIKGNRYIDLALKQTAIRIIVVCIVFCIEHCCISRCGAICIPDKQFGEAHTFISSGDGPQNDSCCS